MNEKFVEGFIKRAQAYGLSEGQAIDLLKAAADMSDLNFEKWMAAPGQAPLQGATKEHGALSGLVSGIKSGIGAAQKKFPGMAADIKNKISPELQAGLTNFNREVVQPLPGAAKAVGGAVLNPDFVQGAGDLIGARRQMMEDALRGANEQVVAPVKAQLPGMADVIKEQAKPVMPYLENLRNQEAARNERVKATLMQMLGLNPE